MTRQNYIWFVMLLAMPTFSRASISAPDSAILFSRDGTRVLVLLSPRPADDNTPTATLPDGRVINVHNVFAQTGVYDVATLQPTWTANWFSLSQDVLASDDLRYVVRRNRFGLYASWALAFYDRGQPVRFYYCKDLLTRPGSLNTFPYSSEDWHYQWYDKFARDRNSDQIVVTTARRRFGQLDLGLQEYYTFDLSTGRIVSKTVVGWWMIWLYGIAAILIPAIFYFIQRWIRQRRRAARENQLLAGS